MRKVLAVAALAFAVAGCSGKKADPLPPPPPPPPVDPGPVTCLPGCAGTRAYDAIAYALSGQYDWTNSRLVASEEITLTLPAGAGPVVELDATMQVTAVHAGSQRLAYAAVGATLRVDLGPLTPGTSPVTFTVDYTAKAASVPPFYESLWETSSTARDPVRARVVFTDSEPHRGRNWLVQKDDPSDPALFSVALTVAADEDMVANGDRVSDEVVAGGRRVAYALDVPIATYLMAFAAGQLEHVDRPTGSSVPLALWYRRGLAIDPAPTLDAVADAMATFEALLGPYPFPRYAVVLQPMPGWGMENATITIESEDFDQDPSSTFELNAHELAHHWFGDYVTMHGYDDVWIKEGMATLLAAEADRGRSDVEGRGRLLASTFAFGRWDAIVDTSLTGVAKYTSGPYLRSAALITQIRARVGEAAFWAHLRQFLADHAWGSATGEQFVRAFAPDLTEPEILQVLAILPQVAMPSLAAQLLTGAGAPVARLTLADPDNLLLVPYQVTVVDAAGAVTTHMLTPGFPLELVVPVGGYIAPDEGEVHPDTPVAAGIFRALSTVLQPTPGTPAGDLFASRSASHQERALRFGGLPPLAPAGFQAYYDSLDSDLATVEALAAACHLVATLPAAERGPWISALAPIFQAPRSTRARTGFLACGPALGATLLAELQALAAAVGPTQMARLEYLLWFDYDAAGQAAIAQVAGSGPSLRLRDQATARIAAQPLAAAATSLPRPGEFEGKARRMEVVK
jgi:hypothetical protein